jgi:hypothetical protein
MKTNRTDKWRKPANSLHGGPKLRALTVMLPMYVSFAGWDQEFDLM